MSGLHPFFDVDQGLRLCSLVDLLRRGLAPLALEVASEMLEQGDFFLELLGEIVDRVGAHHVLLVYLSPLHVLEVVSGWVEDDFRRVVEEDSGGPVAQQISESVLGGVVDPLFHPGFAVFRDDADLISDLGASAQCVHRVHGI